MQSEKTNYQASILTLSKTTQANSSYLNIGSKVHKEEIMKEKFLKK